MMGFVRSQDASVGSQCDSCNYSHATRSGLQYAICIGNMHMLLVLWCVLVCAVAVCTPHTMVCKACAIRCKFSEANAALAL